MANDPSTPPRRPHVNGLSMTEYSSIPTPKTERADEIVRDSCSSVPEDYILPTGYPDYLRLILTSRVYDVVEETPLQHATNLSNRLECKVLLKREDLLPVFSFKLRGAYNKMAHLTQEQRWKGVIACSAGNHAQGVAYSARKLKIPATIVMPSGTPAIKHLNVSRLGGSVVLHGSDFDAAKAEAHRLEKVHNLTNIPPFDDPYVIAGQGTVGMEIVRQAKLHNLEAVFCCIGGGGLIAGVGAYIKRIAPHVKIIGVETYDANAMVQSLKKGERVMLKDVGLFADGAAVKLVGEETFRICQDVVDDIIQVTTDEICAAIKDVFEDTRSILEPAGALALAGLKKYVTANPDPNPQRELVAVTSGANMDFDRLRFVAERAALGEKKEVLLSVTLPEKPGAYATLIDIVTPHPITAFNYRFGREDIANVLMGISLPASLRTNELQRITAELKKAGMKASDLSDDELVKTHIRYLVGGPSNVKDERVFMFQFPERPGALQRFLGHLRSTDNVTLFHYRNHGGDVGHVLAGIQCAPSENAELTRFLNELGYPYEECTNNAAYKMFLRRD
ncbi:threonine deaminase [Talaromyces marneffei ATCC 18224]|uniref:Threonine dehydratase n=2 Tax=Talaromyces marneffei TaxID=37727 RepID=B6QHL6_TALMQ|nr:uncharacterized protein EYB26_007079 [Talaromyces marneffei]EEA22861.1 threonine dehydratase, biosynthetic [Talaromyces marneffei ATCC 18224]KAE8551737.1 hypothetical protein EYB25_005627 [Talaromyces marneffei]QGA19390.1 hypothetical protein EYB26_007079 [Talaromyces marneffei]